MNSKEVLGYLAIKHSGDWVKVYNSIKEKESISTAEVENTEQYGISFLTVSTFSYPPVFHITGIVSLSLTISNA